MGRLSFVGGTTEISELLGFLLTVLRWSKMCPHFDLGVWWKSQNLTTPTRIVLRGMVDTQCLRIRCCGGCTVPRITYWGMEWYHFKGYYFRAPHNERPPLVKAVSNENVGTVIYCLDYSHRRVSKKIRQLVLRPPLSE